MTFGELKTKLNNELEKTGDSDFWDTSEIESYINSAIKEVANYHRWDALEGAKTINSSEDREKYDMPDDIRPKSITLVELDGDKYERVDWDTYQANKDDDVSGRYFTTYEDYLFIQPTADEGGLDLDAYGREIPVDYSTDSDVVCFPDDFELAIVKLAKAEALKKKNRYDQASVLRGEVFAPQESVEENQPIGNLDVLIAREQDHTNSGYQGQSKSSRWD